MTTEDETRDAVHRILGDVHLELTEFPGGNISLTVSDDHHSATVDGHPVSGYGWTVDPGEDDGFTGHDQISPTLEDALEAVRAEFGLDED